MREIIFLNEFLGNFREFYAHMLRSIHWVLEIKVFYVKADKARIFLRQDTVNHDLDEVEVTFGCAYIAWVVDGDTRDSDTCTIGILLLRSDLTHNHGVANLFSSISRDIFKSNDAEGVCAIHTLVPGAL